MEFIEVDTENFERVADLRTHESQKAFVAPMLWSFSDALFPEVVDGAPVVPWMRAVMADDELVGFVMMALATDHHPDPYPLASAGGPDAPAKGHRDAESWRWSSSNAGSGAHRPWSPVGRRDPGSPRPFYLGLGFEPTGRIIDEETEGRLAL